MDAFILVAPETADWRFNGPEFVAALVHRWPEVKVKEITDEKKVASHRWSIRLPESPAKSSTGFLARTGEQIGIDGTTRDCAEFACWLRTLVPANVELRFYDERNPSYLIVHAHTSVEDFLEKFGDQ